MTAVTRCKMQLNSITRTMGSKYDPELPPMREGMAKGGYAPAEMQSLKFHAVADGSEENKRFFASTPQGTLELGVVNEAAVKNMKLNAYYYIDISEAVTP